MIDNTFFGMSRKAFTEAELQRMAEVMARATAEAIEHLNRVHSQPTGATP